MTLALVLRNKRFYLLYALYFLFFVHFSSLTDWDGLLNSSGSNLFNFIIINFNIPSYILLFLNISFFVYILFLVFLKNKFIFIFMFFSPMFFLNVMDAYNKFVFTIFIFFLLYEIFLKKAYLSVVLFLGMFSLNPIYSVFSMAVFKFKSKREWRNALIFIFLVSVFFVMAFQSALVFLLNNEKVALFLNVTLDLLNFSEGNFGIKQEYLGLDFFSYLGRVVGFLFPYFFIKDQALESFIFSLMHFLFVVTLFFYLKPKFLVSLIILVLTYFVFLTNYAHAFRHIYVFISIVVILNYYPNIRVLKNAV